MILKSLLCYAILLVTVQASGDLVFLHQPKGVTFIDNETIKQSEFTDVGLMLLGLTPRKNTNIQGRMSIKSPFDAADALIVIAIEGSEKLDGLEGHHFPFDCNEQEEATWTMLSKDLSNRYNESFRVRFNLGDNPNVLEQSALGELKYSPPKKSENVEDRKFLEELHLLDSIKDKIPSSISDNKKTLIWLMIPGLNSIIESQGKESETFQNATRLLIDSLNKMSESIANIKDQKVILAAFTSCLSSTHSPRFKRAEDNKDTKEEDENITVETTTEDKLLSENVPINNNTNPDKIDELEERNKHKEDDEEQHKLSHSTEHIINTTTEKNIIQSTENPNKNWDDINTKSLGQETVRLVPGPEYDSNYPILFNIFLWFAVAFIFSLIAICVTIADMDPGRDSIIYRMTSNRMKKDN